MGMFDDLTADIPGAAVKAGGAYDDLTQDIAPADGAPGPNNFRVNWGPFGHQDFEVDPNGLWGGYGAPLLDTINYGTNSVLRGMTNTLASIPEALYVTAFPPNLDKKHISPEDAYKPHWGTTFNDAAGIPARPHDAGFGTDVLEGVGGSMAVPGGGGAGGFFRTLAGETASSVGGAVGNRVGGWVGEQVGGDAGKRFGEFAGDMGGSAVPSAARATGDAALRANFAKPNGQSGAAYDALTAANITPTTGLVSNKQGARTMNSTANFPWAGGVVQERQQAAFNDFQSSLYNTTDQIGPRTQPGVEQPMPEQTLGGMMRRSAGLGEDNLNQYFESQYNNVFDQIPDGALVEPNSLFATVNRQNDPFAKGATSNATRASVNDFVNTEIIPELRAQQGPSAPGAPLPGRYQGPARGGEAAPEGVPINQARAAGSEAFYDRKANQGTRTGGAIEQNRQGFKNDIVDTINLDPSVVGQIPDPMVRQALAEQMRVLETEYALANARDVSRAGTSENIGGRYYVGGDRGALKTIQQAAPGDDASVVKAGSTPGNMAVLARTDPSSYPRIAAEVVRNEAQSKQPYGDINVSPQVFASWWNSLDPHSKAIYTNEQNPGMVRSFPENDPAMVALSQQPTPVRDSLNNLGQVGELFRQAGAEANPSGTAPTLAMMGLMSGLFTHPMSTLGILAGSKAMARGASSLEMAQAIANRGRSMSDYAMEALTRGLGHQAASNANPNYGGPR